MRRILLIFTFAALVVFLSVTSLATHKTNEYVFKYDNVEVCVRGDKLDFDEAEIIAQFLVHGDKTNEYNIGSNRSVICDLFGHKLDVSYALVREHHVSQTQPKCIEKEYKVTRCTRSSCDYLVQELVGTTPLYSCH
jgi:hypothetical protein